MSLELSEDGEFIEFPPGSRVSYNNVECSVLWRSAEHTVDLKRLSDEAMFPDVFVSRLKKSSEKISHDITEV